MSEMPLSSRLPRSPCSLSQPWPPPEYIFLLPLYYQLQDLPRGSIKSSPFRGQTGIHSPISGDEEVGSLLANLSLSLTVAWPFFWSRDLEIVGCRNAYSVLSGLLIFEPKSAKAVWHLGMGKVSLEPWNFDPLFFMASHLKCPCIN